MPAGPHPIQHLGLETRALKPAEEWVVSDDGWTLVQAGLGLGYAFDRSGPQTADPGDVFVLAGRGPVTFRASRIGPLTLHAFGVRLTLLKGLLSPQEIRWLTELEEPALPECRRFPADHEVARLFGELGEERESLSALLVRSRLIEVFAMAASHLLSEAAPARPINPRVRRRFDATIRPLAETELLAFTASELARRCGCSERHFNRLFRESFGYSIRSRQIELRMRKAQELLRASDARVTEVARESGFRHRGLFSLMFKRRFGLTPSQWQQQQQRRRGLAANLPSHPAS